MVRAEKHRAGTRKLHEKLLRQISGPLILSLGIFYFTFHALSGERGLYALLKEQRHLEVLKAELSDVTSQRKDLEHRVRLLSAGSLDRDLLDEQARSVLNEADPDEVMVPLPGPVHPIQNEAPGDQ